MRKNKALDLLDKDFSVSFLEPDTRNYVAFSERFYSICHSFQMENFDSTNNWFICHFPSAISLISVLARNRLFFLEVECSAELGSTFDIFVKLFENKS